MHRVGKPVGSGRDDVEYPGKHPTVTVKPCQSQGTPQGVAQVLTYLAPEMGKETPCELKVTVQRSRPVTACADPGSGAAPEGCCPVSWGGGKLKNGWWTEWS